jgi:hypothetical protein
VAPIAWDLRLDSRVFLGTGDQGSCKSTRRRPSKMGPSDPEIGAKMVRISRKCGDFPEISRENGGMALHPQAFSGMQR